MKKITLIIIFLFFTTVTNCIAENNTLSNHINNNWTGLIRIEGKETTIWNGEISVSETTFFAKNVDTGENEEHYISYPSVLGAVIEASKSNNGNFGYAIEYYPSYESFIFTSIEGDGNWWQYWVDDIYQNIGASDYELTSETSILFAYKETWPAQALHIMVDKSEVKRNEEFTAIVTDFDHNLIADAIVIVGSESYVTGVDGKVMISLTTKGMYDIYAEKEGFVRSEKVPIQVKRSNSLHLNFQNFITLFEHFKLYISLPF
jgi:uncharacterized protein DUF4430